MTFLFCINFLSCVYILLHFNLICKWPFPILIQHIHFSLARKVYHSSWKSHQGLHDCTWWWDPRLNLPCPHWAHGSNLGAQPSPPCTSVSRYLANILLPVYFFFLLLFLLKGKVMNSCFPYRFHMPGLLCCRQLTYLRCVWRQGPSLHGTLFMPPLPALRYLTCSNGPHQRSSGNLYIATSI